MNVQRIVSLAPSNTEIVFALGAGAKLVGVTGFCDYPAQARLIEQIGGFSSPDIGKIISLLPDLVLATDFHLEMPVISRLKARGINTEITRAGRLTDIPEAILLVGRLLGCRDRARRLAGDIRRQIKTINTRTKHLLPEQRPRVCYICAQNPLRFARESCCAHQFIEIAGGANIGRELLKARMSFNTIVERNPDVIIVGTGHGQVVDLINFVNNQPVLQQTNACRNNRVYRVSDDLVTRGGPRAIEGLQRFAELIHPEIFAATK